MDDPAATGADIEVFPSFDRLHFIAFLVAGVKAVVSGPVPAQAKSRLPAIDVVFEQRRLVLLDILNKKS